MGLTRRSLVTLCLFLYLFIYLSLFADVVHPEDIPGLCWGWTLATNERNQRQHKQMERYSMFLGRKNQYCENDYTTKCNLQIQCDPYQITNGIFHRTGTKNFTIHMETQKTLNSQSSLEKEEWSWRNPLFWLQITVQSYSHQDSMVLAHTQKKKCRPME